MSWCKRELQDETTVVEDWSITEQAEAELRATVGHFKAERGVMLGGCRKSRRITHVYFDHGGRQDAVQYSPDHQSLNSVLRNNWNPRGIELLGFGHSHPPGFTLLSDGDKAYARAIMAALQDVETLLLPIFQSAGSGTSYGIWPYLVRRTRSGLLFSSARLRVEKAEIRPFADAAQQLVQPTAPSSVAGTTFSKASVTADALFARVVGAYDLDRLRRSRLVSAGCGGSVGFLEDMARCGVGEFVLIDPDVVSASNIGTQMTYVDGIGQYKVDVVAERLRRINPNVVVVAFRQPLDDLDDAAMRACMLGALREGGELPVVTLLCGFTDSFHAQARVNRLALNFGLPSLCAQVYAEGRGAELTFTHPETTRACHRCILRSRFSAYLEQNFVNTIGSASAPIFTTTRLNAAKGPLALALLHHGTSHPRWGGLLTRIGDRNLVQLRLDPDLALPVFAKVFGKNKRRVLFDEPVWLPQMPEKLRPGHRACPDCAGTGKLSQARGTFRDTRVMRN